MTEVGVLYMTQLGNEKNIHKLTLIIESRQNKPMVAHVKGTLGHMTGQTTD